ncbi:hypothetical protein CC86DRAFT_468087 [Ophiobolus disseminans]|uniref:C2H2-type domain-containing protein n=1 Tax=Ophiobolus disseminans TaxID=1469910 RepID=A0A6A6ZWM2_9PLEO|nr:hypothetical protein CC86DRAFT_468087 [Ophiobolus disseminans]
MAYNDRWQWSSVYDHSDAGQLFIPAVTNLDTPQGGDDPGEQEHAFGADPQDFPVHLYYTSGSPQPAMAHSGWWADDRTSFPPNRYGDVVDGQATVISQPVWAVSTNTRRLDASFRAPNTDDAYTRALGIVPAYGYLPWSTESTTVASSPRLPESSGERVGIVISNAPTKSGYHFRCLHLDCSKCVGKKFERLQELHRHIESTPCHGGTQTQCPIPDCDKWFATKRRDNLARHLETSHEVELQAPCSHAGCEENVAKRKCNLNRHLKTFHGVFQD